jgi:hypothetical protein
MKLSRPQQTTFDRALAADVLPAELPTTWQTSSLSPLLRACGLVADRKSRSLRFAPRAEKTANRPASMQEAMEALVSILLGKSPEYLTIERNTTENGTELAGVHGNRLVTTIPFQALIGHGSSRSRRLDVAHPASMINIANFIYYNETELLTRCSASPFSVRFPAGIPKSKSLRRATLRTRRRFTDYELATRASPGAFSYRYHHLLADVYKSRAYRFSEREYGFQGHVDISRFFDSIYTHSISWAVNGKHGAKASRGGNRAAQSFGDQLDSLLQSSNHGETNGILIGPEFCRVAAEVLLQSVDVSIATTLIDDDLVQGRDYEIFRYLDDFIIFGESESTVKQIMRAIELILGDYKLSFNESKTSLSETPAFNGQSLAIFELENAFTPLLISRCGRHSNEDGVATAGLCFSTIRMSKASQIIKSCLGRLKSDQRPPVGFLLKNVEKHLVWLANHQQSHPTHMDTQALISHCTSIIELSSYIFELSPRASNAKDLQRIFALLLDEVALEEVSRDLVSSCKDHIFRESLRLATKLRVATGRTLESLALVDIAVRSDTSGRLPLSRVLYICGIDLSDPEVSVVNFAGTIESLRIAVKYPIRVDCDLTPILKALLTFASLEKTRGLSSAALIGALAVMQFPCENFKPGTWCNCDVHAAAAAILDLKAFGALELATFSEANRKWHPLIDLLKSSTYKDLCLDRKSLVY